MNSGQRKVCWPTQKYLPVIDEIKQQAKRCREAAPPALQEKAGRTPLTFLTQVMGVVVVIYPEVVMRNVWSKSSGMTGLNTCAYVPLLFMSRLKTALSAVRRSAGQRMRRSAYQSPFAEAGSRLFCRRLLLAEIVAGKFTITCRSIGRAPDGRSTASTSPPQP